ncbi:MAG TPA: PIG-L family deacetylase [Methylomirabilota bacterium]|nr:PIG-L family deacetylase [Methylomirabilota bacterium]
MKPSVLAIAAHPDDIEFMMAGTMLLLAQAGCALHYLNVSSGNCGSMTLGPARTRAVRRAEAQRAARILGATWHPSLGDDLEILYDLKLLRCLAAVVREVNPRIVLTHAPVDYMEDHVNTCRLAVTAAFARGMPNFRTTPPRPAVTGQVTVYHALPHTLRDPLGNRVTPGLFVNVTPVHATKRAALAAHASQKEWLDATQGMDSYLQTMEAQDREVGRLSRRFRYAEGWRRHLPAGFCAEEADPLRDLLGRHVCSAPRNRDRPLRPH